METTMKNNELKEITMINTPRLAPSALEIERLRMQMTMNKTASTASVDTVGEIPNMHQQHQQQQQRGVRRFKSSNPNAPTKSTDAAASLRGSAVARANSSRNLLQRATSSNGLAARNGIPARTTSSQGLRSYNKDQIVNGSISRKPSTDGILNMHIRGPGGTLGLQRNESEMSLGEFSMSENSLFTTDSVFLRKSQYIADPLDNEDVTHTYYGEDDSFADHESFMTRDSDVHLLYEVPPVPPPPTQQQQQQQSMGNLTMQQQQQQLRQKHLKQHSSSMNQQHQQQPPTAIRTTTMTLNDLQHLKMNRLHISGHGPTTNTNNGNQGDDISLISYGTMASGLTTDFTDHDYTDGYAVQEEEQSEE